MIDCKYYVNVGRLMGILPRPTPKSTLCTLEVDRAEELIATNLKSQNLADITAAMYQEVKPYKSDSGKRWGQPLSYYNEWLSYYSYLLNYYQTRSNNFVNELRATINNQYGGF